MSHSPDRIKTIFFLPPYQLARPVNLVALAQQTADCGHFKKSETELWQNLKMGILRSEVFRHLTVEKSHPSL